MSKPETQKKEKGRKKGVPAPPLDDFKAWRERLLSAANTPSSKHAKGARVRPRDHPDNVFRVSAYRYYRELKRAKLMGKLRKHIEKRDGSRWDGHGDEPVLWVLRLAATPKEAGAKLQQRRRHAAALKLASLNKVRPELLLGFLHEVGPVGMMEKDARAEEKYDWAKHYRKPDAAKAQAKRRRERDTDSWDEDDDPSWPET